MRLLGSHSEVFEISVKIVMPMTKINPNETQQSSKFWGTWRCRVLSLLCLSTPELAVRSDFELLSSSFGFDELYLVFSWRYRSYYPMAHTMSGACVMKNPHYRYHTSSFVFLLLTMKIADFHRYLRAEVFYQTFESVLIYWHSD